MLAQIIRTSLAEFGANKPGTVYFDPTTDALYELFQTPVATILWQKQMAICWVVQVFFQQLVYPMV